MLQLLAGDTAALDIGPIYSSLPNILRRPFVVISFAECPKAHNLKNTSTLCNGSCRDVLTRQRNMWNSFDYVLLA